MNQKYYKRVLAVHRGGPEVLKLIDEPLREPDIGEVRIKAIASGISYADVLMREGVYMNMPKFPFTPGYDIIGVIDKPGGKLAKYRIGDYVAALTVHGGYSEYVYLPETELVRVPSEVDPREAVSLILNYVTAYQMLFRTANVKAGESILVHGAAGGVGTALLQLSKLNGITVYGTGSKAKLKMIEENGGIPIDYKSENFVKKINSIAGGVDAVFDGTGKLGNRSYRILKENGRLVLYGISSMLKNGRRNLFYQVMTYLRFLIFLRSLIPDGKKILIYQVTNYKKNNPEWFRKDLQQLFQLLDDKKIKPVIDKVIPLEKISEAHHLLNNSLINGKIVIDMLNHKVEE